MSLCSWDHYHTNSFVLHLSQQSHRTSCPRMASLSSEMNNHCLHPNYAWKLCRTILVTKSQKSWLSNWFSPPSNQRNMITLHWTKLVLLSLLTWPCSISMTTFKCVQQSMVKYWEVLGSGKFPKRMTVVNSQKGHILHPLDLRDLPKSVPPTNLFLPGLLDDADAFFFSQSQELTWKLVQNHLIDIKSTKCMVLSAKWVPRFWVEQCPCRKGGQPWCRFLRDVLYCHR